MNKSKNYIKRYLVIYAALACLFAKPIYATAAKVSMTQLNISYAGKLSDKNAASWQKACASLGRAFTSRDIGWSGGTFENFSCEPLSTNQGTPVWQLKVAEDKGRWLFTLTMKLPGFGEKLVAESKISASQISLSEAVQRKNVASLIALLTLNDGPFLGQLSEDNLKHAESHTDFIAGSDADLVKAPKEIDIYELYFNGKYFSPKWLATAKMHEASKEQTIWRAPRFKTQAGQILFFHHHEGRGALTAETSELLQKAIDKKITAENIVATQPKFEDRKLNDSIQKATEEVPTPLLGGFAGVRYGYALIQDKSLENISLISFLTELRGSILEGMRIYYDFWPKVNRRSEGDGLQSFQGDRTVLGWSFELPYTPSFLDRIDLVPKAGLWSTKTVLRHRASSSDDAQDLEFSLKNSLSFALEAGAEKYFDQYMVRLWGARDFSANSLSRDKESSVTSMRAGLDVLWRGPYVDIARKRYALSILSFGLFERVQFEKKISSEAAVTGAISDITYDLGYVGGGIALSW